MNNGYIRYTVNTLDFSILKNFFHLSQSGLRTVHGTCSKNHDFRQNEHVANANDEIELNTKILRKIHNFIFKITSN